MDLKMNKENLPAAVSVYEGIQEQSIDLDYILPDYYPDIFRIVRCETVPVITGWNINGDKLSYELRCDISIPLLRRRRQCSPLCNSDPDLPAFD